MKLVNTFFNTPKIRQFLKDLISDYDHQYYDDLTYADKCTFSSLLIETAGKESENECIFESRDLDKIIHFLKKSLLGNSSAEKNLIKSMKNSAITYYEETMEGLFYDVLEEHQQNINEWNKYVAKYGDPDELYDRQRDSI